VSSIQAALLASESETHITELCGSLKIFVFLSDEDYINAKKTEVEMNMNMIMNIKQ